MAAVVIQQACRQIGREQFTVWLGYTGNLLSNLIETMNLYEIAKVRRQIGDALLSAPDVLLYPFKSPANLGRRGRF